MIGTWFAFRTGSLASASARSSQCARESRLRFPEAFFELIIYCVAESFVCLFVTEFFFLLMYKHIIHTFLKKLNCHKLVAILLDVFIEILW